MKGFKNLTAVAAALMLSAAAFAEESDKKERSQGYVTYRSFSAVELLYTSVRTSGEYRNNFRYE